MEIIEEPDPHVIHECDMTPEQVEAIILEEEAELHCKKQEEEVLKKQAYEGLAVHLR